MSNITLKRARSLPPQQRANSDCGIEINTLPKLPGHPEDDEYFLTINAVDGYYGYALRNWEGITIYIDDTITKALDEFEETDPVFEKSPAAGIEDSDIEKWNTPYLPLTGGTIDGYINYKAQAAPPATPASGFSLGSTGGGKLTWMGTDGFIKVLDTFSITDNRVYILPDSNGTVVLDVATQTLSNKSFTGTTNIQTLTLTDPLTDTYIASANTWNAKQEALVSGVNIKTINGSSVLGPGNMLLDFQSVLDAGKVLNKDNSVDLATKIFSFVNGKIGIGTASPAPETTVHIVNPTTSAFLFIKGKGDASQFANIGLFGNVSADGAAFFTLRVQQTTAGIMTTHNLSSYYYSFMFRLNGTGALVADANVSSGEVISAPSAQFEVRSTARGILIPRMTTAQMNILASTAANGLMVWVTDNNKGLWNYVTGSGWLKVGGVGSGNVESVSGTANRVSVTGGVNAVVDIASNYAGQNTITTLGTITNGVWQGTAIGDNWISSASAWNSKQAALNGTGVVEMAGTTVSYVGATGTGNYVKEDSPTFLTKITVPQLTMTGSITGATTISASGSITSGGNVSVLAGGGTLIGALRTGSATDQSILATSVGSTGMSLSTSQVMIGGQTTNVKMVSRHSSNLNASAGESAAHFLIGANSLNMTTAGTHNIFTNFAVKAPTIIGSGATVTNATTVYIENEPTAVAGVTNTYALLVGAGKTRLNGFLEVVAPAQAGVGEMIIKLGVSDTSTDFMFLHNATLTDGVFVPRFGGITSAPTAAPLAFSAFITSTSDSGGSPLTIIGASRTTDAANPQNGTLSAIASRQILAVRNYTTDLLTIAASGLVTIPSTGLTITSGNITVSSGTISASSNITASGAFIGAYQSYSTAANSNFFVFAAQNASSVTVTSTLMLAGATQTYIRAYSRGATGSNVAVNASYGSIVIGAMGATIAGSGVHPVLCNIGIKPLTITGGTGSARVATVYIEDEATSATGVSATYALLVDAGKSKFNGTINNTGSAEYADNAAALAAGLVVGDFYHTAGTLKRVI